jgi:hypothetical protein
MDKMNDLEEQEKKINYRDIYEKDKLYTITEKDDNTKQNTDNYSSYIKNKLYDSEEDANNGSPRDYEEEGVENENEEYEEEGDDQCEDEQTNSQLEYV